MISQLLPLFFITIINLFFLLTTQQEPFHLWYYYTTILTLASLGGFWILLKKREPTSINLKQDWPFYVVFLLAVGIKLYIWTHNYQNHIFWLDEYSQAQGSMGDPAHGAFSHQQPFLGYLWTKFALYIFGNSVFTIRLHALIASLLGFYYLLKFSYRLQANVTPLIFLSVTYLTFAHFYYPSYEGRCVGVAFLFLNLFSYSFLRAFTQKRREDLFVLGVNSWLFLCSITMQPVLLIGFVMLWLIILLCWDRQPIYRQVLFTLAVSLVLFLPIQILLYLSSRNFLKSHMTWTEKLESYWDSNDFYNVFKLLFPSESYYFIGFALVSALGLSLFNLSKKKTGEKFWIAGLVLTLVYPFFYDAFFFFVVNWMPNPWYSLIYKSAYFTFLAHYFLRYSLRINTLLLSLALGILSIQRPNNAELNNHARYRADWGGLYHNLIPTMKDADWNVFVMGRCFDDSWWCLHVFIGADFYAKGITELSKVTYELDPRMRNYNGMAEFGALSETPTRIVSIFEIGEQTIQALGLRADETMEIQTYKSFMVLKHKHKLPPTEGIRQSLEWMKTHLPKKTMFNMVYETEMLTDWYWGNQALALQKFEVFKNFDHVKESAANPNRNHRLNDLARILHSTSK